MTTTESNNLLRTVNQIGDDALALQEALLPKVADDAEIDEAERQVLQELIERSSHVLDQARERAREKLDADIANLERQIAVIDAGAAADLPPEIREQLAAKRRSLMAQLVHRRTAVATDFAGILSKDQLQKIGAVLERARQDVEQKQKAAAFISTIAEVADLAFDIVRKVGGLA